MANTTVIYIIPTIITVEIRARGIFFFGFSISAEIVATPSKPTNPTNSNAVAGKRENIPFGKKGIMVPSIGKVNKYIAEMTRERTNAIAKGFCTVETFLEPTALIMVNKKRKLTLITYLLISSIFSRYSPITTAVKAAKLVLPNHISQPKNNAFSPKASSTKLNPPPLIGLRLAHSA